GGPGPDMGLHGEDGSIAHARDGEGPIATVGFRLSPRPGPRAERLHAEGGALPYISLAPGPADGLLRYLPRAPGPAPAATVSPEDPSAFTAPGEPGEILLVRAHDVPERLLEALRGVPGVTLFRPASEHIAVEVGWAHPVALSSVASLFPRDRFYLFFGA